MKIIQILLLSLALLLITACGKRVPFAAQEPLQNAALVYLYVSQDVGSDEEALDSYYKVRINNKKVDGKVRSGEYMVFNLKPNATTISVTRGAIIEQALKLQLQAGETYYLKVRGNLENDAFKFIEVSNSVGLNEIAKTGLAGSMAVEEDSIITEFVGSNEEKDAESSHQLSKTDEIEKAYKLKERGIISDEEFQALKTNILKGN